MNGFIWTESSNPLETSRPGIFVGGAASGPKDIPETVTQASGKLAQMLKIPMNEDGFFLEAHMKLRQVDFATEGIFVAGIAHSPKSVSESIAQGEADAECV